MRNRVVFIYALTDPAGNIRYIGQSVHPEIRYIQHVKESAATNKAEWISELLRVGAEPILVILEKTDKKNADYKEKWWITLGRTRGWQLSNMGNPSRSNPDFSALFADQLRQEFEQFMVAHDPVIFVTRRHISSIVKLLHVWAGLIAGALVGYYTYQFDVMFIPPLMAFVYGFTCFVIIAHMNYLWAVGEFRENARKYITMSAIALSQVAISAGVIAIGR